MCRVVACFKVSELSRTFSKWARYHFLSSGQYRYICARTARQHMWVSALPFTWHSVHPNLCLLSILPLSTPCSRPCKSSGLPWPDQLRTLTSCTASSLVMSFFLSGRYT